MPDNQNSSELVESIALIKDSFPVGSWQRAKLWMAVSALREQKPAPAMLNGVEGLESKLRSLYERIRPSVEVAPWVHDEIKAMLAAENRDAAGVDGEPLASQIDRLGKFILDNFPGEPSTPDGAIDVAIRLLTPTAAPAGEAVACTRKEVTIYRSKATGKIVSKHYARTHPNGVTSSQHPAPSPPSTPPPAAEVREVEGLGQLTLRRDNDGRLQLYRVGFNLRFATFSPGVLERERCAVLAALSPPGRAEGEDRG